jgi:plastocyanin
MKARIAVAAGLAALACAPPALAAPAEIRAVDDLTPANNNVWSPAEVSINAGETVTWRYDGTQLPHDVVSTSSNWSIDSPSSRQDPTPVVYRFDAVGVYSFICSFHGSTMSGTVTVGDPPPPPLSEQPFANDQAAPTVFEVTDAKRPRVTRVRTRGLDGAARVRFRLDEPGRVTIRLQRGAQGTTRTVRMRAAGARTVRLRGLAAGRYRVEVRARDLGGNRSLLKRARVTVR